MESKGLQKAVVRDMASMRLIAQVIEGISDTIPEAISSCGVNDCSSSPFRSDDQDGMAARVCAKFGGDANLLRLRKQSNRVLIKAPSPTAYAH